MPRVQINFFGSTRSMPIPSCSRYVSHARRPAQREGGAGSGGLMLAGFLFMAKEKTRGRWTAKCRVTRVFPGACLGTSRCVGNVHQVPSSCKWNLRDFLSAEPGSLCRRCADFVPVLCQFFSATHETVCTMPTPYSPAVRTVSHNLHYQTAQNALTTDQEVEGSTPSARAFTSLCEYSTYRTSSCNSVASGGSVCANFVPISGSAL